MTTSSRLDVVAEILPLGKFPATQLAVRQSTYGMNFRGESHCLSHGGFLLLGVMQSHVDSEGMIRGGHMATVWAQEGGLVSLRWQLGSHGFPALQKQVQLLDQVPEVIQELRPGGDIWCSAGLVLQFGTS